MKKSYIFIDDVNIPIGNTYYTVDKKTFKVTERECDGENNTSYNYYFRTKKEATHASECLDLHKLIRTACCIPVLRQEKHPFLSIHTFISESLDKLNRYVQLLVKEHDGNYIYEKHHKQKTKIQSP